MQKEYRQPKGSRIFVYVFLSILIGVFIFLGSLYFTSSNFNLLYAFIATLILVGLIFGSVIGIIHTKKNRLIVENNRFIKINVFTNRILEFKEIKGYKFENNLLIYVPVDKKTKPIKTSAGHIERFWELKEWTIQNFNQLDNEADVEIKEILNNEDYGTDDTERNSKLQRVKKHTKVLNIASWIAGISMFAFPYYYNIQITICILLPIIGLTMYLTSKGLIRLDEKPKSPRPNIHATIFVPSLLLGLRIFTDVNVLDYTNFWQAAVVIMIVYTTLIVKSTIKHFNTKTASTYLSIFITLIFLAIHTYGTIISTNVILDKSAETTYKAKVIGKHISTGKTTHYYLELERWGSQEDNKDIVVAKSTYDNTTEGNSVNIYLRNGLYGIPYYYLDE
ncbi:MAG: hypothetical protein N4A72_16995 [Bacteroidales bacterium]|jgi:hypothetical protein|nr:hypothetical protein [Bacteroidales bacterium]